MHTEQSPLLKVLVETVGELCDVDAAADLCNALYHHTFGIRLPAGVVADESPSMRQAAEIVERIFQGRRPGLEAVTTPAYEYAYWLRFIDDPPSIEQRQRMESWLKQLRRHPQIVFIRYNE